MARQARAERAKRLDAEEHGPYGEKRNLAKDEKSGTECEADRTADGDQPRDRTKSIKACVTKNRPRWHYVCMTAGMTKFLRIYYGKVRDCLKEKGLWEQPIVDEVNPC